jgi:hypothetical protein
VRICPKRDPECSSQTEIGKLEVSFGVDEKVLRFEIAMEDTVSVAEVKSFDKLESKSLKK